MAISKTDLLIVGAGRTVTLITEEPMIGGQVTGSPRIRWRV